jgi:hypothetical protein
VPTLTHMNNNDTALFAIPAILLLLLLLSFSYSPSVIMGQQQTTGGATPTPSSPQPTPPLTPEEQEQQNRLQNVIASTTANLQETQKQISGVVFTPRWSQPVWVNANSVSVLVAYCLPGEFADSGQEILGGFELEVLESYAIALPQGFMAWMAVVGNEDLQNRRFPAALGVICASDLNNAEARVLSPQEQQVINNINQQFTNIQNTQITDIDNVINIINNVTANETATTEPVTPPPPPPTNDTIEDTTPPVIDGPDTLTFSLDDPAYVNDPKYANGFPIGYTAVAEDNVDGTVKLRDDGGVVVVEQDDVGGDITIQCNPPGSLVPFGSTTFQCTAEDQAGNVGTYSWTWTFVLELECPLGQFFNSTSRQCELRFPDVIGNATIVQADTIPPVVTVPNSFTFTTSDPEGRAEYFDVSAEDNVDGSAKLYGDGFLQQDGVGGDISIECNPPSGSIFPVGFTKVQCTATDASGNTGTASFHIGGYLPPPGALQGEEQPSTPPAEEEEVPPPPPTEPEPEPTPEPTPTPEPEPQPEPEDGGDGGEGGGEGGGGEVEPM